MTSGVRFWLIHLAAASVLAWPAGGRADGGRDHDHDRARQALEAGEVLPLRAIIERVERSYPGQVLEVELERDGGRWIYEIKTAAIDAFVQSGRLTVNAARIWPLA